MFSTIYRYCIYIYYCFICKLYHNNCICDEVGSKLSDYERLKKEFKGLLKPKKDNFLTCILKFFGIKQKYLQTQSKKIKKHFKGLYYRTDKQNPNPTKNLSNSEKSEIYSKIEKEIEKEEKYKKDIGGKEGNLGKHSFTLSSITIPEHLEHILTQLNCKANQILIYPYQFWDKCKNFIIDDTDNSEWVEKSGRRKYKKVYILDVVPPESFTIQQNKLTINNRYIMALGDDNIWNMFFTYIFPYHKYDLKDFITYGVNTNEVPTNGYHDVLLNNNIQGRSLATLTQYKLEKLGMPIENAKNLIFIRDKYFGIDQKIEKFNNDDNYFDRKTSFNKMLTINQNMNPFNNQGGTWQQIDPTGKKQYPIIQLCSAQKIDEPPYIKKINTVQDINF